MAAASAMVLSSSAAPAVASAARAGQPTARRAPAAARAITWHKLTLRNGWQSSQPQFGTGDPSYAVSGGVVYLSGSLKTSGSNELFAVLPKAARPGQNLQLMVYTINGTFGSIQVSKNGTMSVQSDFANANQYTSLAAIAYPAVAARRHKLTLINTWRPVNPSFGLGAPAYAIKSRVVYLSGGLHRDSGSKTRFAMLPRAARPAHLLERLIYSFAGTPAELQIFPSGPMSVSHGDAPLISCLAGVGYTDTTVGTHALRLINGWRSEQRHLNTGNPAYIIKDGVVYLSGALHQPSGTRGTFAVLPRAARPKHNLWIAILTSGGTVGTLFIPTTGRMELSGISARSFSSLAAISYPRTS